MAFVQQQQGQYQVMFRRTLADGTRNGRNQVAAFDAIGVAEPEQELLEDAQQLGEQAADAGVADESEAKHAQPI